MFLVDDSPYNTVTVIEIYHRPHVKQLKLPWLLCFRGISGVGLDSLARQMGHIFHVLCLDIMSDSGMIENCTAVLT